MKKLLACLMPALLLVLASCSKGSNNDAESLLHSVPADASAVVLFNLDHTVKSLGGKVDGGNIVLPDDLKKTIFESEALKPKEKKILQEICDGETGVAISSLIFFSAARDYFTGLLDYPDKFVSYVSEKTGIAPVDEGDAKVIGRVAVIGNQFWISPTGTPDAEQLRYYLKLSDSQSFSSSDAAASLHESEDILSFVTNVNTALSLVPQAGYVRLASSMIFEDMKFLSGSVDLKDKALVASALVLNSKLQPAKLLIPVEKIDPSVIKSFGSGAAAYFAAGIPKKLTKKISDVASSMMSGNAASFIDVLQAIDGTVAVRVDANADNAELKIQTTGKNFSQLSTVLQNLLGLSVSRDGDTLTAVRGTLEFSGNITPEKAADMLKGAWIGMVSDGFAVRDVTSVAKLSVEKNSLRLDFEADGGLDALITVLTK